MAIITFGAGNTLVAYREFKELARAELRLNRLSGTIMHLDEVLTMSAKMAAITGAPEWERRYLRFEPELDAAIKETMKIAPDQRVRHAALRLDQANVALVAMEHRAFDLVRSGRREEARQLLDSNGYEEQKVRYAREINDSTDTIQQRVDDRIRHHAGRVRAEMGLTVVAFVVIALGWSALLRLVRSSVAERLKLVHQLEAAVKAREDLLSVASHELKTPLSALTLQVQSMTAARRHVPSTENLPGLDRKLAVVERQLNRLSALLDALLDISRISSGRLVLTLEDDLDLSEVVRETLTKFEGELARASCELRVRGADQSILGRWDRLRLEQVLGNLLANALKYGAGKPIEVQVTANEKVVHLVVRDQGIGIAVEQQATIFERFERAVPERQYHGFGLGLWIVRKIVTAMNGEVSVTSRPQQGATFQVVLPRRVSDA